MHKGIVLAGGRGTRLYPTTKVLSKQLQSVYNKPMIYYPLQTLKEMGIVDILIITSCEEQRCLFEQQLGDGSTFDLNLQYTVQESPGGIPEAFTIGESFIGISDVTLILGDNVIITNKILKPVPNTIYTYKVKDPSAYGVAVLNQAGNLIDIVEKPETYISDNAIIGLYTFTREAVVIAKGLKPSRRNELEIVDLISKLNEHEGVEVEELDGFWFDCGNHNDLLDCANLVRAIEQRTNKIVGLYE